MDQYDSDYTYPPEPILTPFWQGRRDYRRGLNQDQNPFTEGHEAADWLDGWMAERDLYVRR